MPRPHLSKNTGRRLVVVVAFALVMSTISLLPTARVQAQAATFTTSTTVPFSAAVFVPCTGEVVALSGELHLVVHTTLDGRGGFHSLVEDNPQGVSGIGLTTGQLYQATGVTLAQFNGKVGAESTFVNNFRVISRGPGSNFLVHANIHGTLNANGELTAFVDHVSIECQ